LTPNAPAIAGETKAASTTPQTSVNNQYLACDLIPTSLWKRTLQPLPLMTPSTPQKLRLRGAIRRKSAMSFRGPDLSSAPSRRDQTLRGGPDVTGADTRGAGVR